jgi:hypothetical protein
MQQLGVSLNAVHLHDVFEDDVNIHMVMELCEGGALLERVESGVYSEKYISRLVRSILRFIAQCHAKVRSSEPRSSPGVAAQREGCPCCVSWQVLQGSAAAPLIYCWTHWLLRASGLAQGLGLLLLFLVSGVLTWHPVVVTGDHLP